MARGRYGLTLVFSLVAILVVTATLHDHDAMTADSNSTDDMAMGHLMPVAPAAAYRAAAQILPRTGWTATASDEETTGENGRAANVLDGDRATIWHSSWSGTPVPLPHSLTIDMKQNQLISGLYYLPRAAIPNGRISRFEIVVSADGLTWSAPIATGTWADDDLEKSAAFATVSTRYVRLTAITDAGNRGPWSSAAEINILGEPDLPTATPSPTSTTPTSVSTSGPPVTPGTLSRVGWTVSASDEESAGENGVAANVLDGDAATIWHSRWSPTVAALPHTITVDMKASYSVSGFRYLPRPSIPNGRIGGFQIHVSADGVTWGTAAASGTWADNWSEKTVSFAARSGRYVRLTATSEAGNRGPWSSAAELNVLGVPGGGTGTSSSTSVPTSNSATSISPTPTPTPTATTSSIPTSGPPVTPGTLSRVGWTVSASDEESAGENGVAANVLDGDAATIWHSRWSPTVAALPHTITVDMKASYSVSGFRYLPRPSIPNGRIGGFQIHVSADGVTWGTAAASGTWADNWSEKTVSFAARSGRYVRLTATSEAGNRGPWSSAAELNVLGVPGGGTGTSSPTATSTTTPPPSTSAGSWGPVLNFPLVPVAAALLPGNKMLTWSAYLVDNFGGNNGRTQTAILDINTGVITARQVSNTGHDMFCPGTSMLPDGRLLVSGGSDDRKTSFYDPVTDTWTAGPNMNIPRAYQSNVTLSNGSVFSIGGSWKDAAGGKNGELWTSAGGWRNLSGVPATPILTADPAGIFRSDNHAWLFATSGGRVLQAGPSRQMNWITTSGNGTITSAGQRSDSTDAMNGDAVMYDVNKIITMGGSTAYDNVEATRRAYHLDLSGGGVAVNRVADMAFQRAFANGVALPDGQVLVVGGQEYPVALTDTRPVLTPELWNPVTQQFRQLAPMAIPRTYHSVALLLPDARVFVGGGGLCGNCATNHPDGQIFTPPYLLNADGSARPRPTITSAPATAAPGATISVTTGQAVSQFSLVRTSSVTHTVNTDQRRIPLAATTTTGNTSMLALPADTGVLVPGSYLLFALNAAGVPSVAATIRIS